MAAVLAGAPDEFGTLFDRHSQRVLTHCYRLVGDLSAAEDLTSVVFLEAWRRRASVRFVNGSALPWLLVTATNVSRNHARTLRRQRAAPDRLPRSETPDDPALTAADRLDARRKVASLRRALDALSDKDRQIIVLCVLGELSYADVARVLALSEGAVRNRLSRSKQRLRECLADSVDNGWEETPCRA